MNLVANYHTHCKLCHHANGMPSDYIKRAIELGMEEIGISDHGPVDESFMTKEEYINNNLNRNMKLHEFYNIYLPELEEAINKYSDQIKIYKGLECEYLPSFHEYYQILRESIDYMNLGIHFYEHDGRIYNTYGETNHITIYYYLDNLLKGIESGLFKIVVHPDVFMYMYRDQNGERKWDKNCEEVSRKIIEAANKKHMYLELNCQGFKNSHGQKIDGEYRYPYTKFWDLVKEYPESLVIIGADAHDPSSLDDDDINKAYAFLEERNIKAQNKINF